MAKRDKIEIQTVNHTNCCDNCTSCAKEKPGSKRGECRLSPPGALGYWPKIRDVYNGWCEEHSALRVPINQIVVSDGTGTSGQVQTGEIVTQEQVDEAFHKLVDAVNDNDQILKDCEEVLRNLEPSPGPQTMRPCDHCGKPTPNMEDGTFIFCDACREGNHKQSCDICGTPEGPFETQALHVCRDCQTPDHPDLETVLDAIADAPEPWVKGYMFRRNGVLCMRLAHDVPNGVGHTLCITGNHVAKVTD